MRDSPRVGSRSILFISQVYPPDPAAVGQHIEDASVELVQRGHRVTVITSDRGYDDPSTCYPARETRQGVRVVRVPFSSLGKQSIRMRLIGGISFLLQATARALLMRGVDRIVLTTVPPLSVIAGAFLVRVQQARVLFWIMDLNPDQLVALGIARADSLGVRALDWFNVALLRRASAVIALDRYMADRVRAKVDPGTRLHIAPPWAHEKHLEAIPHEKNPFRAQHRLAGKRVIMYSGNHAMTNPLSTILDAARRLRDDDRLVFMFIGGGKGKAEVDAAGLPNVVSLPYQPLEQIKYSLSAADVHVVSIGQSVVGIVHPCKIYGAMAVGRPILSFGPTGSHVADLVGLGLGWHLEHGDVDGAVDALVRIASMPQELLDEIGARASTLAAGQYDSATLRGHVCDIIDGSEGD